MKNLLFLFVCLFTFSPLAAQEYKYETVSGDITRTRIYTLPNGLKVYLSVNKEKPRIQTYIAVRTGSKNDPAETTGLAHYLEHLMFKGTRLFGTTNPEAEQPLLDGIERRYEAYRLTTAPDARRQAYHEIDSVSQLAAQFFIPNEYDKLMAAIGAVGTNAFTSDDVTCYTEDIPSNEIDNWAKIQADRFQNMVIRGFHTELEAVYEEYNMYLSDDGDKLMSALGKKLTPTHPYGTQTTIGTQEHLKNPSIKNIKEYFRRWYVPNNVAICMAGDFDPDKTIAVIDRYFGAWKPAADVAQPKFPEQHRLTAHADTTVIGQQAEQIWMGWLANKASDMQSDTLRVIDQLLSNGRAGIFDLNLNQAMAVQEAASYVKLNQDYSTFMLIGMPKPGQSLEEVRSLLLAEIENLKQGNFPDELLPSVINNMKLQNQQAAENNLWRTREMMYSFVYGQPWEQRTGSIERMATITKQQITDFAQRFFTDSYATVFKLQGTDTLQKKIDKPLITPIPANRDLVSQFVREIQQSRVEPIQPEFLDFKRDLTFASTKKKLPVVYKQNTENDLFQLAFRYEFGHEDDNRYDIASSYLEYVGTSKLTAADVKKKFYQLACSYGINVGSDNITVSLSGLKENMLPALQLLEDLLQNAKADKESYEQFVALILKNREDSKADQQTCYDYLTSYGMYGPHNMRRSDMTADELRKADPQQLLDLLKNLSGIEHSVLYYGPLSVAELDKAVSSAHKTPKRLAAAPQGVPFKMQPTQGNEIWIAPYEAKNIYMRMFHNEQREFNTAEAGVQMLFNEYFGGGMNGIVFQELRESRGLAYSAYANYARPYKKDDREYYFTNIITQNDKMMDCVRQFHSILDDMPQSEAAFRIAKEAITKLLASYRTTKFSVIGAWLTAKRMGIDYDINKVVYEQLPAITLKDIADFEKRQMANKSYRYLILGDEKELDMPALEKIAPIRRLTLEEIFGY